MKREMVGCFHITIGNPIFREDCFAKLCVTKTFFNLVYLKHFIEKPRKDIKKDEREGPKGRKTEERGKEECFGSREDQERGLIWKEGRKKKGKRKEEERKIK